jgi:hypothetical protein
MTENYYLSNEEAIKNCYTWWSTEEAPLLEMLQKSLKEASCYRKKLPVTRRNFLSKEKDCKIASKL